MEAMDSVYREEEQYSVGLDCFEGSNNREKTLKPNPVLSHWTKLLRRNLLNVLDFLGRPNASELVSGTKDRVNLYEKFRNAINAAFPGTIDQLRQKAHEKMTQKKKLTFWESVTDANAGGFKFSF